MKLQTPKPKVKVQFHNPHLLKEFSTGQPILVGLRDPADKHSFDKGDTLVAVFPEEGELTEGEKLVLEIVESPTITVPIAAERGRIIYVKLKRHGG
jgi:hypothetical protein